MAEEPVNRLRSYYERSGFTAGSALFLLAARRMSRPDARPRGIERCHGLLEQAGGPFWQSFILPMLAALEAMDTRIDLARAHLEEARLARREFSEGGALATSWAALAGEVELLAGDPERRGGDPRCCVRRTACGRRTRVARDEHGNPCRGALSARSLRGSADASGEALELAPHGHLTSLAVARRVRAKALARAGDVEGCPVARLPSWSICLQGTDVLDEQGEAFAALAEVHALAGIDRRGGRRPGNLARACFEQEGQHRLGWRGCSDDAAAPSGSGGALSGSPHLVQQAGGQTYAARAGAL